MRWTDASLPAAAFIVALALAGFATRVLSAEAKRLSVNAENGIYFVPVVEREGQDYVDARELLQPLGEVRIRVRGDQARLRSQGRDIEFRNGSSSYEVTGKRGNMAAPAIVDSERLLLPYASLPAILNALLRSRVDMNHNARRIFLGESGIRFTTEIARAGETSLLRLRFSAPVNPTISTEAGKLRMSFQRDPVTAAGENLNFDDRLITGANFIEANGLAVLEVSGTAPLIAEFGDGGRLITITAAPGPLSAAAPPPEAVPPSEPPAAAPMSPLPMPLPDIPATAAGTPQARYLVVIDASHGGGERGAALTEDLAEKDVALAFARRLRTELRQRGIATLMMRDADLTIPLEHRAETANVAHAAVYISIHASTPASGVRVYTSMLHPADRSVGFVPWEQVQASYVSASRKLVESLSESLKKARFDMAFMPAPVRPLNSIAAAAVAIELSPPRTETESILNSTFQASLASAVAAGIVQARAGVEAAK